MRGGQLPRSSMYTLHGYGTFAKTTMMATMVWVIVGSGAVAVSAATPRWPMVLATVVVQGKRASFVARHPKRTRSIHTQHVECRPHNMSMPKVPKPLPNPERDAACDARSNASRGVSVVASDGAAQKNRWKDGGSRDGEPARSTRRL